MILGFTKTWTVRGKKITTEFENKITSGIKIHTVRQDVNDRWREGMKIQFANGVRTRHYNCFKVGECISVQDIFIGSDHSILIDNKFLDNDQKLLFAKNDGFDCIQDFWEWFDVLTPFEGKVIHWTNKKY